MLRANAQFNYQKISKEEFVETLTDVKKGLEECILCLEMEPQGTKEFDVCKIAKNDLVKVSDMLLFEKFL